MTDWIIPALEIAVTAFKTYISGSRLPQLEYYEASQNTAEDKDIHGRAPVVNETVRDPVSSNQEEEEAGREAESDSDDDVIDSIHTPGYSQLENETMANYCRGDFDEDYIEQLKRLRLSEDDVNSGVTVSRKIKVKTSKTSTGSSTTVEVTEERTSWYDDQLENDKADSNEYTSFVDSSNKGAKPKQREKHSNSRGNYYPGRDRIFYPSHKQKTQYSVPRGRGYHGGKDRREYNHGDSFATKNYAPETSSERGRKPSNWHKKRGGNYHRNYCSDRTFGKRCMEENPSQLSRHGDQHDEWKNCYWKPKGERYHQESLPCLDYDGRYLSSNTKQAELSLGKERNSCCIEDFVSEKQSRGERKGGPSVYSRPSRYPENDNSKNECEHKIKFRAPHYDETYQTSNAKHVVPSFVEEKDSCFNEDFVSHRQPGGGRRDGHFGNSRPSQHHERNNSKREYKNRRKFRPPHYEEQYHTDGRNPSSYRAQANAKPHFSSQRNHRYFEDVRNSEESSDFSLCACKRKFPINKEERPLVIIKEPKFIIQKIFLPKGYPYEGGRFNDV